MALPCVSKGSEQDPVIVFSFDQIVLGSELNRLDSNLLAVVPGQHDHGVILGDLFAMLEGFFRIAVGKI